jgi:uncharacterized protein (TIGR02284 family)
MATPQAAPHTDRKLVAALNHLLETCIDAEKGYASVAADARDVELKKLLMSQSQKRGEFVVALGDAIRTIGAVPMSEGDIIAPLHRGWIGVRKAIEGRSDRLLLEEVLVAEERARERYARGMFELAAAGWTPQIRSLVESQYAAIRAAQEELGWFLKTLTG